MRDLIMTALVAACLTGTGWAGSEQEMSGDPVARRLEQSLAELARVRQEVADEKIPLMRRLAACENELIEARDTFESITRQFDRRSLRMNNLRAENQARETQNQYLSTLLSEYHRNLETRLHIAELNRYGAVLERSRLAPESAALSPAQVFAAQMKLVQASLERLEGLVGGDAFDGRAAGEDGLVKQGSFLLVGPVAYFASVDGVLAGLAEQRHGTLEPSVEPYADPAMAVQTRSLVATGEGLMPFDGSLGNARKVEETRETLLEHIAKGGPVMKPILGMAAVVLLVALVKLVNLSTVLIPTERRMKPLLHAVAHHDRQQALVEAGRIRGVPGDMLRAAAEHMEESKELVEEVMFERLLAARYRFNRALPLIAIGAACAPLLGLLGTVTGIINTFKLITIFGSGDVKMLSAGISEALITTEFGLLVAIPSLLFHAFLSRKSKTLLDKMEQLSISFLSELTRSRGNVADLEGEPAA